MEKELFYQLHNLIQGNQHVCLLGHSSPDGDCIMASFALHAYLQQMGKDTDIALEGKIPYNYDHYIDRSLILTGVPQQAYDVAIAVDCVTPGRLGSFASLFFAARHRVVIDHHITNRGFGQMNIMDGKASSTCELIYRFFRTVHFPIDKQVAEFLYIGILTDTGKFRYPSTKGHTHRAIGDLIDHGAEPDEIYKYIFRDKPLGIVKACGAGMAGLQIHASGKAAIAKITKEIAALNDGHIDEIDGIIDWLMEIRGVQVACVLKEVHNKLTKVSLRSEKGYNLKNLVLRYHGGGHEHAAGFHFPGSVDEAEHILAESLQALIYTEEKNL